MSRSLLDYGFTAQSKGGGASSSQQAGDADGQDKASKKGVAKGSSAAAAAAAPPKGKKRAKPQVSEEDEADVTPEHKGKDDQDMDQSDDMQDEGEDDEVEDDSEREGDNEEVEDASEEDKEEQAAKRIKVSGDSKQGKAVLKKAKASAKKKGTKKAAGGSGAQSVFAINVTKTLDKDQDAADAKDIQSPKFDPSHFNVDDYKHKKDGKGLKYCLIAEAFDKIDALKGSGSSSKKMSNAILTNLFRIFIVHCPGELNDAVYLCMNKVAPDYEGIELGVGDSLIIKAISEMSGRTEAHIKKDAEALADLGQLAVTSRQTQRMLFQPEPLAVRKVLESFRAIAKISGNDAQKRKKDKVKGLLVASKGSEAKYIVRHLQGRLRIGVQAASIFSCLGQAFALTCPAVSDEDAVGDVRRKSRTDTKELNQRLTAYDDAVRAAACECPNIDIIVDHLIQGTDASELPDKCQVQPGLPVKPMLAKPTKGISEVLDRFSECNFTCEYKYDGERLQVHVVDRGNDLPDIRFFSRSSEDLTTKYPDVESAVRELLKEETKCCILDCEVTAFDVESKTILPFQHLATRKRKDVNEENITVKTKIHPFDCIYYNGQSLVRHQFKERRECMWKCLTEDPNRAEYAKFKDLDSMEDVQAFLDEAVRNHCEGLMVKSLDDHATYEPSKRSLNWLKIKKDYIEGMTDSIDVIPIGAFHGKGKRQGVFGAYLLAVYDAQGDQYETICKAGTGFSDEALEKHSQTLKEHIVDQKPTYYKVTDKQPCDVWFKPVEVWEIKGADMTLSTAHTAASELRSDSKGIGLRFPRFLRIRDDKNPDDATTSEQILELYDAQFTKKKKE